MSISNVFVSPEVPQISDQILLAYLREHRAYLYDIEKRILEICGRENPYGEIVVTLKIINGMVEKSTSSVTYDTMYQRREKNVL